MAGRRASRRGAGRAVVVGSGPNGLTAAAVLARAGLEVTVHEAAPHLGGAAASTELLAPGAVTDLGSAVHPLGAASPAFAALGLERHGLEWVHPQAPLAHPLDGRPSALLERSLPATMEGLGGDGRAWARLLGPVADRFDALLADVLRPVLRVPTHPVALGTFGARALWPASAVARGLFRDEPARALFAGLAAHAVLPLGAPLTSAFGVLLGAAAHAVGWPVARGGSGAITRALAADLAGHGGRVVLGSPVDALEDLGPAELVLLDVGPRELARLARGRLSPRHRRSLRGYRYGTASYKVDYLLDGPVPWRDPQTLRAATVHLGGGLGELAQAEADAAAGRMPQRPFVLLAQQSLSDRSRAPEGREVVWTYCHVPRGYDGTGAGALLDAQVERFAPGFRDRVLARVETPPSALERWDRNLVGGDISGGSMAGLQSVLRPRPALRPYATPLPGVFLCSSSTPPGGGVHGMCGWHAARAALRWHRRRRR